MERAAGLPHDDTAQVKRDKLDALLPQTSTSKQDATLFAEMLSLPNDGRYPALIMDLQQRRQKTLEALTGRGADRLVAPALQELRRGVNDGEVAVGGRHQRLVDAIMVADPWWPD